MRFVAIDLETTGVDPERDRIIEIGAVRFGEGEEGSFHTLVNPGVEIPPEVVALTGITPKELEGAPAIDEIKDRLLDFLSDFPLVGHNVQFDISFLKKHMEIKEENYDTFVLSKILLPFAPEYRLGAVAEYLSIPVPRSHRAADDARTSGLVFLKLLEIIKTLPSELISKIKKYAPPDWKYLKFFDVSGENRYPFTPPPAWIRKEGEENLSHSGELSEIFESGGIALVEGPSSLYLDLLPLPSRKTVFIATATRRRREEIFRLLMEKKEGFTVSFLARREDYLCRKKLENLLSHPEQIKDREAFLGVLVWEHFTETGDMGEYGREGRRLRRLLRVEKECEGAGCPFYETCYYYRARRRVRNSSMVLTDHRVFLENVIPGERVVFEEACELEDSVRRGLGFRIYEGDFDDFDERVKTSAHEVFERVREGVISTDLLRSLKHAISSAETQDQNYKEELEKKLEILTGEDYHLFIEGEGIGAYPIHATSVLEKSIYPYLKSIVFISEVMTVEGSFEFIKKRLGLSRANVKEIKIEDSEFYKKRVLALLPLFLPSPGERGFLSEVSRVISDGIRDIRKGSLVLFTASSQIREVFDEIHEDFLEEEITLLAERRSGSRSEIIKKFMEDVESVLLGSTYWKEIDVPGKSLEVVAVVKLPFPNPDDPLRKAKEKEIRKQGGDPFRELDLPWAVMKMRQGFKRLIRHEDDRGVFIILDKRIKLKDYGEVFLSSLPVEPEPVYSLEELKEKVKDYLT